MICLIAEAHTMIGLVVITRGKVMLGLEKPFIHSLLIYVQFTLICISIGDYGTKIMSPWERKRNVDPGEKMQPHQFSSINVP